MNSLLWNVGGIATSLVRIQRLGLPHKIQILAIIEPKKTSSHILRVRMKLKFSHAEVTCDDFLEFVRVFWDSYPAIGRMCGLYHKLDALKKELRVCNTSVFGKIFDKLKHAEQDLLRCEIQFDRNPNSVNRMEHHVAQA